MFHLEHYKRWPLHIHFNSERVYREFNLLGNPLPKHVRVTLGSLKTLPYDRYIKDSAIDQEIGSGGSASCALCDKELMIESPQTWLTCSEKNCPMVSHILCLSKSFLEAENNLQPTPNLIPLQGACGICSKELKWGELILTMKARIEKDKAPESEVGSNPPKPKKPDERVTVLNKVKMRQAYESSDIAVKENYRLDPPYEQDVFNLDRETFNYRSDDHLCHKVYEISGSDTESDQEVIAPVPKSRKTQKKFLQDLVISSDTDEEVEMIRSLSLSTF